MENKEFLKKYDSKQEFTDSELNDLVWEMEEVETKYGENRRWYRKVTTIFKVEDRYFAVEWDEGLTELQENEFYKQPYEVYPEEETKVITIIKWIKKE